MKKFIIPILMALFAAISLATPAFAANYNLEMRTYELISEQRVIPLATNINVYNSAGSVVCFGVNVAVKSCILPQGTYTYRVSKTGYNTETGTVNLANHMVQQVYLVKDTLPPSMISFSINPTT